MAGDSERRAAREIVASYHEEQLGELVRRVEPAIAQFQAGEIDAFEVDEAIFSVLTCGQGTLEVLQPGACRVRGPYRARGTAR